MSDHDIDAAAARIGVAKHPIPARLASTLIEVDGMVYTSGHTSAITGQVGDDLSTEDGIAAAREALIALLSGVLSVRGTLSDLDAVKLLGCVNASTGYSDHPLVMNAASQTLFDVFGPDRGSHARSALGFSSLPGNAAVEIEAIFRVVTP